MHGPRLPGGSQSCRFHGPPVPSKPGGGGLPAQPNCYLAAAQNFRRRGTHGVPTPAPSRKISCHVRTCNWSPSTPTASTRNLGANGRRSMPIEPHAGQHVLLIWAEGTLGDVWAGCRWALRVGSRGNHCSVHAGRVLQRKQYPPSVPVDMPTTCGSAIAHHRRVLARKASPMDRCCRLEDAKADRASKRALRRSLAVILCRRRPPLPPLPPLLAFLPNPFALGALRLGLATVTPRVARVQLEGVPLPLAALPESRAAPRGRGCRAGRRAGGGQRRAADESRHKAAARVPG